MKKLVYGQIKKCLLWSLVFHLVMPPALLLAKPRLSGYSAGRTATINPPAVNALPVLNTDEHPDGLVDGVSSIDTQKDDGSATMEIQQTQTDIVVNWESFDVGENASVIFNQEGTNWSALNRIWDANPSAIFGQVEAKGRIFLINQNGMVFGPNSRVNAHTLVASSLDIAGESLEAANEQWLQGDWKQDAINLEARNYQDSDWDQLSAEIINQGNLTSDGDSPGAIFLVGPQVTNTGTITAVAGQVGLVAGTEVALKYTEETDNKLERNVTITDNPGEAVNAAGAVVSTEMGRAGMYGRVVNQEGLIRAVTALDKNGVIELMATERVTTGADSVTETPISGSSQTYIESFDVESGKVIIGGLKTGGTSDNSSFTDTTDFPDVVTLQGRITNPGGEVTITAESEVILADGSLIDVSGEWVDVSAEANQLEVQLNSVELSDFFYVRDGDLKGETVYVNALEGCAVGHIDGYLNGRELTARERFTSGGKVTIKAGTAQSGEEGTITVAETARIDFSGGGTNYAEGEVKSSKVRLGDQVFDISEVPDWALENGDQLELLSADEARRLGMPESTTIQAYQEGDDAGTLQLTAVTLNIRGELDGAVTQGLYQNMAAEPVQTIGDSEYQTARGRKAPEAGTFILGSPNSEGVLVSGTTKDSYYLTNFEITAGHESHYTSNTISDDILNAAGLGSIKIFANDTVTIDDQARIVLAPSYDNGKESFLAKAANITHAGEIYAPGGNINLSMAETRNSVSGQGRITIASGSKLVTAGEKVDYTGDPVSAAYNLDKQVLNGGTIILSDTSDEGTGSEAIIIASGSVLDVSGGYAVDSDGRTVYGGDAGELKLSAPAIVLAGDIQGHSLKGYTGGTLTLHARNLVVENADPTGVRAGTLVADTLYVTADKLAASGFSDITLESLFSPELAEDLQLSTSRVKYDLPLYLRRLYGPNQAISPRYTTETEDAQLASSHLAIIGDVPFVTNSTIDPTDTAEIVIGAESSLSVTPGGSIELEASAVSVYGSLTALSGLVSLEATTDNRDLVLGRGSRIDVHGYLRPLIDDQAAGQPLYYLPEDGGEVILLAMAGQVVIKDGAAIDVSGAEKVTNTYRLSRRLSASETVAGQAGALSVSAKTLDIDPGAELTAHTDLAGLEGGDLLLSSTDQSNMLTMDLDLLQQLAENGFDAMVLRSLVGIDWVSDEAQAALSLDRHLVLDAPLIANSAGIADISLSAPYVEIQNLFEKYSDVNENFFLKDFLADDWSALTPGEADTHLTIAGQWLDMEGQVAINGFQSVALAFSRDIQLTDHATGYTGDTIAQRIYQNWQGGLFTLADLDIQADRVYTGTDSAFTIQNGYYSEAEGQWVGGESLSVRGPQSTRYTGSIYSAGGELTLRSHILVLDNAYLAAPMGAIVLDAPGDDGSITVGAGTVLTAAGDVAVNYGTYSEESWQILNKGNADYTNQYLSVEDVPDRGITLNADLIDVQEDTLLDVSGGGTLYAYGFEPSISGSADPLAQTGRYVILPGNSVQRPGASIYLEGVAGLADGYYSLLPESYAFVSGAIIIEDLGAADISNIQQYTAAGDPVGVGVMGYTGTGIYSSQKHLFAVRSAQSVLSEGQYSGAYMTAGDGGQLTVSGQSTTLSGSIQGAGLEGYEGGQTRLSAANIFIGNDPSAEVLQSLFGDTTDLMILGADAFAGSGFERIELGAVSDDLGIFADALDGRFETLDDQESSAQNGDTVTRKIVIEEGTIDASGVSLLADEEIAIGNDFILNADEFLAVSHDGVVDITTGDIDGNSAINVQRMGVFAGQYELNGRIGVGEHLALGTAGTMALMPDGYDAAEFDAAAYTVVSENIWKSFEDIPTVTLVGQSGITAFEGVDPVVNGDLEIFTSQLALQLTAAGSQRVNDENAVASEAEDILNTTFSAANISIQGVSSGTGVDYASDNSSLVLDAGDAMFIGGGDIGFDGLTEIVLTSQNDMVFGVGSMDTHNADIALTAARITSTYEIGADDLYAVGDYAIDAGSGHFQTFSSGAAVDSGQRYAPGGRLAVSAHSIDHHGTIDILGGHIYLTATGEDGDAGLFLHAGSEILARGGAQAYTIADETVIDVIQGGVVLLNSAGGRFELAGEDTSDPDNIAVAARIDVSHANEGDSLAIGYDLLAAASDEERAEWADAGLLDAGTMVIDAAGSESVDSQLETLVKTLVLDGLIRGAGAGSTAQSWGRGGVFSLDAHQLDVNQVAGMLTSGGFDRRIALRSRTGDMDIHQGTTISADQIQLVADGGAISHAGTLDASGDSDDRSIALYARDDVNLLAGSLIDTSGTGSADGGDVTISSAEGWVDMAAESIVDVSGDGQGGTVDFIARRYVAGEEDSAADDENANDVKIDLSGTIRGARRINAQAKVSHEATSGRVDSTLVNLLQTQTDGYMANAADNGVLNRLVENLVLENDQGEALSAEERLQATHLVPHVEVRQEGDLEVTTDLDFTSDWHFQYGDRVEAGVFTLRAGGDLDIKADIVDTAQDKVYLIYEPYEDDTWSFNLVAGADLTSADPLAVTAAGGDLTISNNQQIYSESGRIQLAAGGNLVMGRGVSTYAPNNALNYNIATYDGDIRAHVLGDIQLTASTSAIQTATGDIFLSAGGDIDLSPNGAAIRTLGRPEAGDLDDVLEDESLAFWFDPGMGLWDAAWGDSWATWKDVYDNEPLYTYPSIRSILTDTIGTSLAKRYWDYQDGGDIRIQAGGDVIGNESPKSGWMALYYYSTTEEEDPDKYCAAYDGDAFSGIGTLAGGNLSVDAGGSVNAPIGVFESGDLNVKARENLDGRYLVNQGQGYLNAMGSFGQESVYKKKAVLELGKGDISLKTQGDIALGSVLNPLLAAEEFDSENSHYLYIGYSEQSTANITSVNGDVEIAGDSFFTADATAARLLQLLPAHVAVTAGGDILINSESLYIAPSSDGQLSLTAGQDIRGDFNTTEYASLVMSAAAPEMYYTDYARPADFIHSDADSSGTLFVAEQGGFSEAYVEAFMNMWEALDDDAKVEYQGIYDRIQSSDPLHWGDYEPVVIQAGRDIYGLNLKLPKAARISAGRDIIDLYLQGQNLHSADDQSGYSGDITSVRAGRDILLNPSPNQMNTGNTSATGLELGGPGWLLVQAGGAIDLGSTSGIQTIGQENNSDLDVTGASVIVAAGYDPSVFMDETQTDLDPERVVTFFEDLRDAGLVYSALKRGQIGSADSTETVAVDLDWIFSIPENYAWARDPQLAEDLQTWLAGYTDYDMVEDELRDDLAERIIKDIRTYLIEPYMVASAVTDDQNADPSGTAPSEAIQFETALSKGNISMVQSQIVTKNSGSIYMMVGDTLDVGLSAFGDSEEKIQTGINAQFAGDIAIFSHGDINVNESRVMTWYGGDITMWSDKGSINAGKGSKTTVNFATNAKFFDEALQQWLPKNSPPAVGSGIRLLTHDPDGIFGPQVEEEPGNGYLYAPDGDIDAGEAGIKGLGLLVFEAKRLLNVQNIEAGGNTIGASLQPEGADSIGNLSGVSAMNETNQVAEESSMMKSTQERFKEMVEAMSESLVPRWLAVEVTGFEDEDEDDEEEDDDDKKETTAEEQSS